MYGYMASVLFIYLMMHLIHFSSINKFHIIIQNILWEKNSSSLTLKDQFKKIFYIKFFHIYYKDTLFTKQQ